MTIKHRNGAYDVQFSTLRELASHLPSDAMFITDENVHRHYAELLPDSVCLTLPAGETFKNMEQLNVCLEWMADKGVKRSGHVVALGGGVIGDLVGFAAAAYMRGIAYTQVPTTLLAQVDSSVGGKVGVDLPQGKNLAGAFHPPFKVVVSTEFLATLPARQFTNGMAEVWKYGLIRDSELIDELHRERLTATHPQLEATVRRCIRHKRDVVEADEFETTGIRATLNFGHTIGHALEQMTGYSTYLHGEAISIGMVAEAALGETLGITEPGTYNQVHRYLQNQGLPVDSEVLQQVKPLVQTMLRDKKAGRETLSFSFLSRIGECKLVEGIMGHDVENALTARW